MGLALPVRDNSSLVYSTMLDKLRQPRWRFQPPEELNREQRNIAHQMACTRKGCTRCEE